MPGLNLLDRTPDPEEPPPALPEEPLGLPAIRRWLQKPRPTLHRLWLWVPHVAKGIRKGYGWLRENSGPALRRTAETLRKAARVVQNWRETADRLRALLERTFPPGSRGREVAKDLAGAGRSLGRVALGLVGLGRAAQHFRLFPEEDRRRKDPPEVEGGREVEGGPPETERTPESERTPGTEGAPPGTGSAPPAATPPRSGPDEPRASTGADPASGDEPTASAGPAGHGDSAASSGPAESSATEAPQPEPPRRESSQPESSEPEPSRGDPPAGGSAESGPAATSPVPELPPGRRAEALAKLSKSLRGQILRLGKRPRKKVLRYTIWWIVTECGEMTSEELGVLLDMDASNLAKRHLSDLVEEGVLERTIPDKVNHPDQAYRATGPPPGADGLPSVDE